MTRDAPTITLLVFGILAFTFPLGAASVTLSGRVVDENEAPVGSARITVRAANSTTPGGPWQSQTDPTGTFALTLPQPGDYLINVDREGYYALRDHPIHAENDQQVTLVVSAIREVFQSTNVNEETSPVDISQTRNAERLTGTEINDVFYPNSHSLRNAMKLMPGVLEDPTGALHFNGSSENQVLYVLNGFDITDPISNLFQTKLAVEGVRSLDYSSARYSPEFGKGSAGVLAINTENGTDAFHYTTTDFIPGISIQHGLRIGNWYPRVGASGPIVRGRAWFSDTFNSEYTSAFFTDLPSGQNTRSGWAGSNLLHTQINMTPANILFADFLLNVDNENRLGLGALDPVSTTLNVQTREYFGSVKDQIYLGHGALVEFGYAHNYFSDGQTPQGQNLYVFSPAGRSGNYFVTSTQTAARDQVLINGYLPSFQFFGSHQIKAGVDDDFLYYNGDFRRTGYELIGISGQLLSKTLFQGSGLFHLSETLASAYVLDTWRVSKRLQLDLGLREDWDRRIGDFVWSPRLAFSWAPFASARTRISGGYSITPDAVSLEILGRPLDQSAVTTNYNLDGIPAGPPLLTAFTRGNGPLELPRASNWSIGVDHEVSPHLFANAKYLRRRTSDGFAFVNTLALDAPPSELPLPNAASGGIYQLTNLRNDDYDAFQVSARQTFSGQYEWMISYTRSRAQSNAVLDFNSADPLQVLSNLVPMPWDSPNRVLGWAYLPLPWKKWAVAVLADARTGYPFSVQQQTGVISGAVDSRRYPLNFDLDIAIERMVTLRGYRFALRVGMDNVTDQANPTAVDNTIGSAHFLQFYGAEGRHFVARIRFFGRAAAK